MWHDLNSCFFLMICTWDPPRRAGQCVFIAAVPIINLFACGEGDSEGHVLRETTRQGLCGLVCPSHTSERGQEGDCVKEGGGGTREEQGGAPVFPLVCLCLLLQYL
jgi:hypothetical protein